MGKIISPKSLIPFFVAFSLFPGPSRLIGNYSLYDASGERNSEGYAKTTVNSTMGLQFDKKTINDTRQIMFSYARLDRSGSAIFDMLRCQAYAFSRGFNYGGACPKWKRKKKFVVNNFKKERNDLIRMLGLNFEVYSECPKGAKIVLPDEYGKHDTSAFASEYIDYLRSISPSPSGREQKNRPPRITVHIRRGDVSPCGNFNARYLPNQHYLKLIQLYKQQLEEHKNIPIATDSYEPIEVLIFSESESFESFDDFKKLGYKVELDGSLSDVWKNIVFDSDVVILSRSHFSLTAAILSQALAATPPIVVYTPFEMDPMPQFDNVGILYPDIQSSTEDLYRQLCEQRKRGNDTSMVL